MVKQKLVEVAFWPDESVGDESVEVFAEGDHVEDLHAPGLLSQEWRVNVGVDALSVSSEPHRQYARVQDEHIGNCGGN